MAPMKFEYPKGRPNFYAYKVIRLMTKTRAVDDIGALGFVMISIVATTEDAIGYRKAVTFWNNSFMQDCGIGSKKTFMKVRDLCVEFGWLKYESTGTRKPNRYFSTIPDDLMDYQDKSTDEYFALGENNTPNSTPNSKPIVDLIVNQSGPQKETNPTPPSSLTLDLKPNPSPNHKILPAKAEVLKSAISSLKDQDWGLCPDEDSPFKIQVTECLVASGFEVSRGPDVEDNGMGKAGFIDLQAKKDGVTVLIELGAKAPGQAKPVRLRQADGARLILLRNGNAKTCPDGIDRIISLGVPEFGISNESKRQIDLLWDKLRPFAHNADNAGNVIPACIECLKSGLTTIELMDYAKDLIAGRKEEGEFFGAFYKKLNPKTVRDELKNGAIKGSKAKPKRSAFQDLFKRSFTGQGSDLFGKDTIIDADGKTIEQKQIASQGGF